MKKVLSLIVILMILSTGVYAGTIIAQYSNVKVTVDGNPVSVQMYNIEGRNFGSVADIAKAMGGNATWDSSTNTVKLETSKTDLEKVVAACKDSCVMIYCYKSGKAVGRGSGFAYTDKNGNSYIVTAKHVTDMGDKYMVFTDESIYGVECTLKPLETDLDVAILEGNINLPSVTFGDSDSLVEGQKLVAITSPKGFKNSIDECVYFGKGYDRGKHNVSVSETEIESGSSGGAVFSSEKLVGMVIIGGNGQAEAVPINDIKGLLN